jgi:hypothetical protein
LAALLHQHPPAKDQLRTLQVRAWEALPTTQQTWVRTNIARNQARPIHSSPIPVVRTDRNAVTSIGASLTSDRARSRHPVSTQHRC